MTFKSRNCDLNNHNVGCDFIMWYDIRLDLIPDFGGVLLLESRLFREAVFVPSSVCDSGVR